MKRLQRGVASIEFVLGFMAFWLMCSVWVEMSYMSYVSSIGDLAISKASREAKKITDTNYATYFVEVIENDSLASRLVDAKNFTMSVQYLETFDDLTDVDSACAEDDDGVSECDDAVGKAIALYRISYNYDPIFSYFLDRTTLFSREMIVIQEYQRDQFEL